MKHFQIFFGERSVFFIEYLEGTNTDFRTIDQRNTQYVSRFKTGFEVNAFKKPGVIIWGIYDLGFLMAEHPTRNSASR